MHTTHEYQIETRLILSSISHLWAAVGGDKGEGKEERQKKRKRAKEIEVEVERSPSEDVEEVRFRTNFESWRMWGFVYTYFFDAQKRSDAYFVTCADCIDVCGGYLELEHRRNVKNLGFGV